MNSCACALRAAATISASRRARLAVADVGGDRAVQQRRVLRHHADRRAQALLRHVRDVLAVDRDAARLGVVQPQQQVHERRLAGAGAADEPDALAGPNRRDSGSPRRARHRRARSRSVKLSNRISPRVTSSGRAPGAVDARVRHGDRLHAFLHGADVLEDRRDLPAHPAGRRHGLPRERQRRRDGARVDRALPPEREADGSRARRATARSARQRRTGTA